MVAKSYLFQKSQRAGQAIDGRLALLRRDRGEIEVKPEMRLLLVEAVFLNLKVLTGIQHAIDGNRVSDALDLGLPARLAGDLRVCVGEGLVKIRISLGAAKDPSRDAMFTASPIIV